MFFVKNVFSTTAMLFTVYIRPMKHALRQTANLPNQSLFIPTFYLTRKLTFTPILFVLPVDLSKKSLLCLNPVKIFLYFGHSAAPKPYDYVSALVFYETRGSVRGLNRWEYEWLALSPKFNVKQCRWRENSYVFQVDPDRGVIFIAFVTETFFGFKNASN